MESFSSPSSTPHLGDTADKPLGGRPGRKRARDASRPDDTLDDQYDIGDDGRPKTRRVNPQRLAVRLGPDLVAEMEALIVPGAKMPTFAVRKDFQERYNVDRRHIYDYFHSRGLRVAKEDRHTNLIRGRAMKAAAAAAAASSVSDGNSAQLTSTVSVGAESPLIPRPESELPRPVSPKRTTNPTKPTNTRALINKSSKKKKNEKLLSTRRVFIAPSEYVSPSSASSNVAAYSGAGAISSMLSRHHHASLPDRGESSDTSAGQDAPPNLSCYAPMEDPQQVYPALARSLLGNNQLIFQDEFTALAATSGYYGLYTPDQMREGRVLDQQGRSDSCAELANSLHLPSDGAFFHNMKLDNPIQAPYPHRQPRAFGMDIAPFAYLDQPVPSSMHGCSSADVPPDFLDSWLSEDLVCEDATLAGYPSSAHPVSASLAAALATSRATAASYDGTYHQCSF